MNKQENYLKAQEASGLKVGDQVKVDFGLPENKYDDTIGWQNTWIKRMDDFVGKEGEISQISERGVMVKFDYSDTSTEYAAFPYFCLSKIESPIAKGYNPNNLTEEQVGVKDGWRLLEKDEIVENRTNETKHLIQFWYFRNKSWCLSYGNLMNFTYRTKAPVGFFVPEKIEYIPFNLETVPKFNVLFRKKIFPSNWVIPVAFEEDIVIFSGCYVSYSDLKEDCEYSLDGGKTWQPCHVLKKLKKIVDISEF